MMPQEEENRQAILQECRGPLMAARELLSVAFSLSERLDLNTMLSRVQPRTALVLKGLLAREIQQCRAAISICEIGLDDSAFIMVRSLFEGLLALRFIIAKPIRFSACSPGLQAARQKQPPIDGVTRWLKG